MKHPNSAAAIVAMLVGWLVTNLTQRLGYNLDEDTRAYLVGVGVAAVLYIGRRGIKGTMEDLWEGGQFAWKGSDAAARAGHK